jgi:hypothetical protein
LEFLSPAIRKRKPDASSSKALYRDLTEDLFRRAGLCSGVRVVDVGCGVGDVLLSSARLWRIVAKRLVDHLERAGFVVKKRPAAPGHALIGRGAGQADRWPVKIGFDVECDNHHGDYTIIVLVSGCLPKGRRGKER